MLVHHKLRGDETTQFFILLVFVAQSQKNTVLNASKLIKNGKIAVKLALRFLGYQLAI